MKSRMHPLALAAMVALAGCGHEESGGSASKPAPGGRAVQARVGSVQLARVPSYQTTPATIVAETQVQVASRLMGYIREIAVAEGQPVTPGQRLFSIDPVDAQGQSDQARAGLQQAEAAQADARLEYERFAALIKEEAVTRQQFDKMKLQYDIATSRVAQARAGVSSAANQLRYATVTSPIAGVVTRKLAHAGDLAMPGQAVLVLENPARLQVETQVPEAVVKNLKPGGMILVEVDGQPQAVNARVARVSPAADPVSHTFLVKLDIAAPGLRSGLFARVLFPQGERQVLTVPQSALANRAGIGGVFVVGEDGIAQFRMLRTGASRDGQVEVQAGLSAGERIVTGDTDKLQSGDKVNG